MKGLNSPNKNIFNCINKTKSSSMLYKEKVYPKCNGKKTERKGMEKIYQENTNRKLVDILISDKTDLKTKMSY